MAGKPKKGMAELLAEQQRNESQQSLPDLAGLRVLAALRVLLGTPGIREKLHSLRGRLWPMTHSLRLRRHLAVLLVLAPLAVQAPLAGVRDLARLRGSAPGT